MNRIKLIDPDTTQGKVKHLMDGMQQSMGMVPNIMRAMANSPAVLEAYMGLLNALEGTSIDAGTRESIALTTSGINGCNYCAAAHTALGKMRGLKEEEMQQNLLGRSFDPVRAEILQFASVIVEKRGWVDDRDLENVRRAGLGDAEIAEVVTTVATTILSNYFNHIAQTEVDFPTLNTSQIPAA